MEKIITKDQKLAGMLNKYAEDIRACFGNELLYTLDICLQPSIVVSTANGLYAGANARTSPKEREITSAYAPKILKDRTESSLRFIRSTPKKNKLTMRLSDDYILTINFDSRVMFDKVKELNERCLPELLGCLYEGDYSIIKEKIEPPPSEEIEKSFFSIWNDVSNKAQSAMQVPEQS
ncbi:Uncharacterised protein [uncultured archaeon]|nr:Uncharacterised protein [uncultured archaeon]